MQIKVNNGSTFLITPKFLYSVLEEGLNLYTHSLPLVQRLMEIEANPNDYDMDEGYILLDELETYDSLIDNKLNLCLFATNYCAGYADLKRRITDALVKLDDVHQLIDVSVQAYVGLSIEEVSVLSRNMQEMLGHLGIFLSRQFALAAVQDGDSHPCIDLYLKVNGITFEKLNDLGTQMEELSTKFRPRIDLFDEFPDLEAPFYAVLTRDFYDTKNVTKEMVLKVINGEMTETELYLEIGYDSEDLAGLKK